MRSKLVLVLVALTLAGLVAGCQGAQPMAAPTQAPAAAQPAAEPALLVVKGKVAKETSFTKDAFVALGLVKFQAEHPKKGMQDYEGVMVKALLDKVGVQSGAKEMLMKASDGFTATVTLADLAKCDQCALALGSDGKLSGVFPGMASSTWVKDVISIELK